MPCDPPVRPREILLWNVEWAGPETGRGNAIRHIVRTLDPDVICFTEVQLDWLPADGHWISSAADYGYAHPGNRRKVVLWSREPWEDVDALGHPGLPGGRYVGGVTGGLRFIGVCVPWKSAHVTTGRKDRQAWEDHRAYLKGLSEILDRRTRDVPCCLLGDFNQTFARTLQPEDVHRFMGADHGLRCATNELVHGNERIIDHVFVSGCRAERLLVIPRVSSEGKVLSDHVGIRFALVAEG